jgi:ABC-type polysaccharide/polyol phosphate export permease
MNKYSRVELLRLLRLGWIMGSQAFRLRGIGSRLGPLWPSIGLAIRISFIGLVFGLVLDARPMEYIPWLASGWAVWGLLSASITSGAESLINSKSLLLSVAIRKEALVIQAVISELLLLLQNAVVILLVLMVFQVSFSWSFFLIIPGLALTAFFLIGLGMALAPLVARFKDLGHLITSIVGVMFFVLPIMWQPSRIDSDVVHLLLGLNPLYHYLQLSRLPLLMQTPTLANYILGALGAVVSILVGFSIMNRTRHRIMYWV